MEIFLEIRNGIEPRREKMPEIKEGKRYWYIRAGDWGAAVLTLDKASTSFQVCLPREGIVLACLMVVIRSNTTRDDCTVEIKTVLANERAYSSDIIN